MMQPECLWQPSETDSNLLQNVCNDRSLSTYEANQSNALKGPKWRYTNAMNHGLMPLHMLPSAYTRDSSWKLG